MLIHSLIGKEALAWFWDACPFIHEKGGTGLILGRLSIHTWERRHWPDFGTVVHSYMRKEALAWFWDVCLFIHEKGGAGLILESYLSTWNISLEIGFLCRFQSGEQVPFDGEIFSPRKDWARDFRHLASRLLRASITSSEIPKRAPYLTWGPVYSVASKSSYSQLGR